MPFSESRKNLKPLLLFFVFWFIFEGLSYWLITAGLSVRVRHALGNLNAVVIGQAVYFLLRSLLAHVFLGAILFGIFRLFHVRRSYAGFCLVMLSIYVFIYNLVQNPQIFDEFTALNRWAPYLIRKTGPKAAFACAAFFIAGLLVPGDWRRKISWALIPRFITIGGIAYLFFYVQGFSGATPQTVRPGVNKQKNVILVSVDSLRGDAINTPDFTGPTADFLKSSVRFERVITPQANSHASLYSLMTSQLPVQHGVRFNLARRGLETDEILKDSPVTVLQAAGYSTHVSMDGAEYHYFEQGRALEDVRSPDPGLKSLLLPVFFRNRLIFGLLNNPLGFWLMPELKSNSAFSFAYKLQYFTGEVSARIDELAAADKPFFLMIHSCGLHWPGDLTFPYYPAPGFPQNTSAPQFAYSTKYGPFRDSLFGNDDWPARARFNAEIYRAGVRMMREEFLDPVFSTLKQSGLLENSVVILLSDHGENLWDAQEFPLIRFPEHGSSLLFGADSEQSFLAFTAPGIAAGKVTGTVGTVDLMATVLGILGITDKPRAGRDLTPVIKQLSRTTPQVLAPLKAYTSETSIWPRLLFAGQLLFTPISTLPTLYQFNERGLIYYDPRVEGAAIMQKQRAVYLGNERTTLYPTKYGYRIFTCDKAGDPACAENLSHSGTRTEGVREIYKAFAKDISDGTLASAGSEAPPNFIAYRDEIIKHMDARGWSAYLWAVESAFHNHDFRRATRIFEDIAESNVSPPALRTEARKQIFRLCASGAFTRTEEPFAVKQLGVSHEFRRSLTNPEWFVTLWRCAHHVARADLVEALQDYLNGHVSRETALLKNQLVRKFSDQELELFAQSSDYENGLDFQISAARLFAAGDRPSAELVREVENHPRRPVRPSRRLSVDLRTRKFANEEEKLALLEQHFRLAKAYGLTDELAPYYAQKFLILKRIGFSALGSETLRQLRADELPLEFHYGLLEWLDREMPGQGPGGIPLLKIRLLPFRAQTWDYDGDITGQEKRFAERALLKLCRRAKARCAPDERG